MFRWEGYRPGEQVWSTQLLCKLHFLEDILVSAMEKKKLISFLFCHVYATVVGLDFVHLRGVLPFLFKATADFSTQPI